MKPVYWILNRLIKWVCDLLTPCCAIREVGGEGHALQTRLGGQVSDGMTEGGTPLSIQHRFHESQRMT